jgi:ParB/RepB/Spo0J family partition protein
MKAPIAASKLAKPADAGTYAVLPIDSIRPSATNPRKTFDAVKLQELADSIKSHGVVQPILVRPLSLAASDLFQYELVAGERRFRASRLAGMATIPATIRVLSDPQALEIQTLENLQRDDLHPLEEADGYRALLDQKDADGEPLINADALAAKLGKSREYIYGRLKLLALSPKAREAWLAPESPLTASTALLVARLPASVQPKVIEEISGDHWEAPMSYRAAQQHIADEWFLQLKNAPFDIKVTTYCAAQKIQPIAGACTDCPKCSKNMPDMGEEKGLGLCTDVECYTAKRDAHADRVRAEAKKNGQTVIAGAEAAKLMPYAHSTPRGYVKAGEETYIGTTHIDVEKKLGKDLPPPVLIENPHTKELMRVYDERKVKAVMQEKGLLRKSESLSAGQQQRENERKAKLENQIRIEVLRQTVDKAELDHDSLALIVQGYWREIWSESRRRIEAVHGWERDLGDKAFATKTAAMDGAGLGRLLLAMALSRESHVNQYNLNSKATSLMAAAERAGVDHAKIRAELVAADKAAQAPKKAVKK